MFDEEIISINGVTLIQDEVRSLKNSLANGENVAFGTIVDSV